MSLLELYGTKPKKTKPKKKKDEKQPEDDLLLELERIGIPEEIANKWAQEPCARPC